MRTCTCCRIQCLRISKRCSVVYHRARCEPVAGLCISLKRRSCAVTLRCFARMSKMQRLTVYTGCQTSMRQKSVELRHRRRNWRRVATLTATGDSHHVRVCLMMTAMTSLLTTVTTALTYSTTVSPCGRSTMYSTTDVHVAHVFSC